MMKPLAVLFGAVCLAGVAVAPAAVAKADGTTKAIRGELQLLDAQLRHRPGRDP
jgi:hypothetical protein